MFLFIFGCAGSSLLRRLFSSCREQELLSSCGAGSSLQWLLVEHRLQAHGLQEWQHVGSGCSSWAQEHRLNIVAKNLSCSVTCEIFLESTDQTHFIFIGSPLHLPLSYQGNLPTYNLKKRIPLTHVYLKHTPRFLKFHCLLKKPRFYRRPHGLGLSNF